MNKIILVLFASYMSLTGCTALNDKFDCPMKDGATCVSLRDMDNVISKELGTDHQFHKTGGYVIHRDMLPKSYPKRTKDQVAKIWLAPHEDEDGNYHDESYLYTVINKSTWVGTPVKVASKGK